MSKTTKQSKEVEDSGEFLMDVVRERISAELSSSPQENTGTPTVAGAFAQSPSSQPVRRTKSRSFDRTTTGTGTGAGTVTDTKAGNNTNANVNANTINDPNNASDPNLCTLPLAAEVVAEDDEEKALQLKRQITQEIQDNAPLAVAMPSKEEKRPRRMALLMVFVLGAVAVAALAGGMATQRKSGSDQDKSDLTVNSSASDESISTFTLIDEVRKRNSLRCGVSVFNLTAGVHQGIEYDLVSNYVYLRG